MDLHQTASSYDEIAGMYDDLWSDWYLPAAMPALERLFFSRVAPGARVLDLCCGSGHVTKELVARGYVVTAVDNSKELIALAGRRMPGTDVRVLDARHLALPGALPGDFNGVLSTFDSLNHILSIEDLELVFAGVRAALKPGGRFVFDMNIEEAYSLDLKQWSVDIKDASVGMVRGQYDPVAKLARTELVWFVKTAGEGDCWRQKRSVVEQRCYSKIEILHALSATGFRDRESFSAADAGITSDLGFGRVFFVARV